MLRPALEIESKLIFEKLESREDSVDEGTLTRVQGSAQFRLNRELVILSCTLLLALKIPRQRDNHN
jgi:hypothetical protein